MIKQKLSMIGKLREEMGGMPVEKIAEIIGSLNSNFCAGRSRARNATTRSSRPGALMHRGR